MNLYDILNPVELADALRDGHVRAQSHPTKPLTILNYTEKAQFERAWNKTTLTCRGLIVHQDHPTVLARPFPKFFNHDEPEAADIDRTGPVVVTDKLDGSLGILYHDGDDWAIATRGSFASEQAKHATALYRRQYAGRWEPREGLTYLFEIIYPENRIVIDYGETDDLLLLGAVRNRDGAATGPHNLPEWPGASTQVFDYATYADALAAEPRPNAEGYVIQFIGTGHKVKVKQEDYKALHRIVTGWNERTIWELLKTDHDPIRGIIDSLPDEFHAWATSVINDLESAHNTVHLEAVRDYHRILNSLPEGWARKDFAIAAQSSPYRPALFSILDGNNERLDTWAWDQVRPETN